MRKNLYVTMVLGMMAALPLSAQKTTVSTFEDTNVTFTNGIYWNGEKTGTPETGDWGEDIYHCSAVSGLATINVNHCVMDMGGFDYEWWGGVALSKSTSTAFTVLDDQYNNIVGSGANGSATFGVIYGNESTIDINVDGGALVKSIYVTNSAYTYNNFTENSGNYDTKFTTKGDHIYLNIVGTKADGTTKTVQVNLAEFTKELTYLEGWTLVDLSSLGNDVTKLTFNFDCNKEMVATYACIDDIEVVTETTGDATFENLPLDEESYWNGSDDTGSFVSGGFLFENGHEVYDYGGGYVYDYCYGFFYTNMTSTVYGGDPATEQYKSSVGHGAENSAVYATYNLNTYNPKGVVVLDEEGTTISGCYLTNNAYAYTSMTNGDSFAKKFEQGDWFKLTITGINAAGETTGSVDFYLADLTSTNVSDHFILNDWKWCDLTSLGNVKRLSFSMSSSDNGDYGMNTPAYFCMDNLNGTAPTAVSSIVRNVNAVEVMRFDASGRRISAPQKGINIIKMSDGTVRKVIVK